MKRLLVTLALTCALSGVALGADMPTCGVTSPGDIPSTDSSSPGDQGNGGRTDGDMGNGGASAILTILDLLF